jgi:hypothetical protein
MSIVLLLGSGPDVVVARQWPRAPFDQITAINNAWRVRPDWDALIHPWDFPDDRRPVAGAGQTIITQDDFVPAQNAYGGFVYAGGTMVFTAAYWVLHALRPRVLAVLGCDLHYPARGPTHFYGRGSPDPLRVDITLQSLEAKSARLMIHAARQGCALVNLSSGPTRQVFPRAVRDDLATTGPLPHDQGLAARADAAEADLGYVVPSGRYWDEVDRFDPLALRAIDALWLRAIGPSLALTA